MARFTVSVSDEVKALLDGFAEEKGFNRSEALELMIRHFFAEPTEESDSEEQTTSKDVDNPEVWAFLKEQYEYLAQLHEVFVSNTNYASSRLPYYETSRYLVPGIEPPEPPV